MPDLHSVSILLVIGNGREIEGGLVIRREAGERCSRKEFSAGLSASGIPWGHFARTAITCQLALTARSDASESHSHFDICGEETSVQTNQQLECGLLASAGVGCVQIAWWAR